MLISLFTTAVPADAVKGRYLLHFAGLSLAVAVFSCYTAIALLQNLISLQKPKARLFTLGGGAFAVGSGLWATHFLGLLAYHLPLGLSYDPLPTGVSLFLAMAGALAALMTMGRRHFRLWRLMLGAILTGSSLCAMYYAGMNATEIDCDIRYLPNIFFGFIGIAMAGSALALWLAYKAACYGGRFELALRLAASLLLGAGLAVMQYGIMSNTIFLPHADAHVGGEDFNTLAAGVAVITSLILGVTLSLVVYEREERAHDSDHVFPGKLVILAMALTFGAIAWMGSNAFYIHHTLAGGINADLALSDHSDEIEHQMILMRRATEMASISGDPKWEDDYISHSQAIAGFVAAMEKKFPRDFELRRIGALIDDALHNVAALDHQVFEQVRHTHVSKANAILNSADYGRYQQVYFDNIHRFNRQVKLLSHDALLQATDTIYSTLYWISVLIVALAVTWYFTMRSIRVWQVKLETAEEKFRTLAEFIPQLAWMADPGGWFFWYNKRWYDYTGADQRSMLGWGWQSVPDPHMLPAIRKQWQESVATGEPFEMVFPLRRADGVFRSFLTRVVPVHDRNGKIVRWFGTSTDIQDQLEQEEFTRSILESSPDCIEVIDLHGRLISMNEGCNKRLRDNPLAPRLNEQWTSFWEGECQARAEAAFAEALAGRTARFDAYYPQENQQQKWWEILVAPIRGQSGRGQSGGGQSGGGQDGKGQDGKVTRILCIARDINERRMIREQLEAALAQAQEANLAKSEFLANMSHEIRTPMNAVIGVANILGASQPLTQKQRDFIKTLQMSADSLLSLINDLLDISKIETRTIVLETIPFSLKRLIQEVVSMMSVRAREKNLAFTFDGESVAHRTFRGDPARLRQIVLNLCSNAIKFTEHGSVHISVTSEPMGNADMERISISVRDTGIGIPQNKLDSIFQKFVQADSSISRKYGGTGLGLAITRTLAEIMGGGITVESRLGEGSAFTLSLPLPLAREEALDIAFAEDSGVDDAGMALETHPRVLLVEDYAPNVLVATTFLEAFGYSYDVASNGIEAIERVRETDYAATLMDVQMHGMNGFEATRLIRESEKQTGAHMPIIGMTAHALAGDRERCIATGMDDYISKPFNPQELKEKLSMLIKSSLSQERLRAQA